MNEQVLKQMKGSVIASGVVCIVLGFIFLCEPVFSGLTICYFLGAMILVGGLAKVICAFRAAEGAGIIFVDGLLCAIFGILCLARPDVIATILTVFTGVLVIAHGATTLDGGVALMRAKMGGGVLVIIMSVLLIFAGAYMMFAPFALIMIVSGITLLVDGIFIIIFVLFLGKRIQEAKRSLK